MKIVIAIDSFKGSATSNELSESIKNGILNLNEEIEIIICPIADGGEGTVQALSSLEDTKKMSCTCMNPLGKDIIANYIILKNNTAVIEMASASGLDLIRKEDRDPSITTTYGTGDIIKDAINNGVRDFIIGIGGSATNDAGLGMLRSLGFKFYDKNNHEITLTKEIHLILNIDKSNSLKELKDCKFLIACDVNNPLYGKNGASYVYGAQKGADINMIKSLDNKLKYFATVVQKNGIRYDNISGAGAAGGLGFAFLSFLNAELKSGIELILKQIDFKNKIKNADFVITGEGKVDNQSTMGKVIDGIGSICKESRVTCIALTGNSEESSIDIHDKGVISIFSIINSPITLEEAMDKRNTLLAIEKQTEQIFRLILDINNKIITK